MFKEISVPFDILGNMCHSVWGKHEIRNFAQPLHDDMKFDVMLLNSSSIVRFISLRNNASYLMNNREFQRVIPFMVRGELSGNFTFTVHAGKYYSLKYLND